MTDLEITKACAEAMGINTEVHPLRGTILRHWFMDANVERVYNPLYDDAQAMALVKRFTMPCLNAMMDSMKTASGPSEYFDRSQDLNRVIVTRVALLHQARKDKP